MTLYQHRSIFFLLVSLIMTVAAVGSKSSSMGVALLIVGLLCLTTACAYAYSEKK